MTFGSPLSRRALAIPAVFAALALPVSAFAAPSPLHAQQNAAAPGTLAQLEETGLFDNTLVVRNRSAQDYLVL